MRDYFDLLGLSTTARATEIRRRTALHPRRWHPDFVAGSIDRNALEAASFRTDAAVDFISMTSCVDRMQRAFFGERPRCQSGSSQ